MIVASLEADPTAMKTLVLLIAVLVLAHADARAFGSEPLPGQLALIRESLRKAPNASVLVGSTRYTVVDHRFENCTSRKEARQVGRYIKCVSPAAEGWAVTVITYDGVVLLHGKSLDPEGNVLNGECTYYDENQRLRAQGHCIAGLKTGVWERFDARGTALPDKVYYGEDWDAMQVRVGVSTLSRSLDSVEVVGEQ
jgi:hypothetical protein